MISAYCKECVKYTQGKCGGKGTIMGTRWGVAQAPKSGLKFCKLFEFDVQLCEFANNEKPETIKEARQRGKVKWEEEKNQEAFDDFEFGASLSSKDFET